MCRFGHRTIMSFTCWVLAVRAKNGSKFAGLIVVKPDKKGFWAKKFYLLGTCWNGLEADIKCLLNISFELGTYSAQSEHPSRSK